MGISSWLTRRRPVALAKNPVFSVTVIGVCRSFSHS
jgi:hypothetical protein